MDAPTSAAATDLEMSLLEEFAAIRGDSVVPLTAAQIRDRTGIAARGGVHCREDLRVDPRTTVPALADWFAAQPRARLLWNTTYQGLDAPDTVRTSRGTIRAGRVILCVGHDLDQVAPSVAERYDVRRCRLSMLLGRTDSPVRGALFTSMSLLRYDGFAEAPSFPEVRAEILARERELAAIDANLMATRRTDGTILVGDSHATDAALPPFLDEATGETLRGAMETLLGYDIEVVERWQGVYAKSGSVNVVRENLAPAVTAVVVTTGIGMTISQGLAATTEL